MKKLQKKHRSPVDDHFRWQLYEALKARYSAHAATYAEYEAACRRATLEAGV